MSIFAQAHEMLLKTHTIPQVQPNFTMCVSLYRLQLEKYAFIVTFQVLFQIHTFVANPNMLRIFASRLRYYSKGFCFVVNVLKYSMPWYLNAFGNVLP